MWHNALIDGDLEFGDPDDNWTFSVDVPSIEELMALLAVLSSLPENLMDISLHASFEHHDYGVRGNLMLYSRQGSCPRIAEIRVEKREATRDARIERAARSALATLNDAFVPAEGEK